MFTNFHKALLMTGVIVAIIGSGFAKAAGWHVLPAFVADRLDCTGGLPALGAAPAPALSVTTHRLTAVNPQNTRIATAAANSVLVRSLDACSVLARYDLGARSALDIAFSPDGLSLAASASDGNVLVWAVP